MKDICKLKDKIKNFKLKILENRGGKWFFLCFIIFLENLYLMLN